MNLALLLLISSAGPAVSDARADANNPACVANTQIRNMQLSKRQEEIALYGAPITDVIPVADECALPASANVPSPKPTLSFKNADEMKRFVQRNCGDVMDKDGKARAPTPAPSLAVGSAAPDPVDPALGEQKLQQCQAAYQQLNSFNAAKSTQIAWKFVAGTCAAGCAVSWSPAATAGASICMGALAGGTINDIRKMKEEGFTAVAAAVAGPIAGRMVAKQITDMFNDEAKKIMWEVNNQAAVACGGAAASALNYYRRGKTAKTASEAFAETAKRIASLLATEKKPTFANNDNLPPLRRPPFGTAPGTGGGPPGRGPGGGNGQVSASAEIPKLCGESTFSATVQCARAVDKTLPEKFASDEAIKEFEKFSGMSPADLLKDDDSPTRGLTAAMGGNNGGALGDAKTLASALQQLEKQVEDPAESVYASGGGGSGGGGGGDSGDAAMADAVKALMGGLGGEQTMGENTAVAEVNMTEAKMNRSPAAIENDRALSLFERVTYRYKTVTRRMIPMPALEANQQQPL